MWRAPLNGGMSKFLAPHLEFTSMSSLQSDLQTSWTSRSIDQCKPSWALVSWHLIRLCQQGVITCIARAKYVHVIIAVDQDLLNQLVLHDSSTIWIQGVHKFVDRGSAPSPDLASMDTDQMTCKCGRQRSTMHFLHCQSRSKMM